MKFTVSSSALFGNLQAISRVINSKNALPILDCFLFFVLCVLANFDRCFGLDSFNIKIILSFYFSSFNKFIP